MQITIDIVDADALAGIAFDEALMNGGQYHQFTISTDPEKYMDPCLYQNDLLTEPLSDWHGINITSPTINAMWTQEEYYEIIWESTVDP